MIKTRRRLETFKIKGNTEHEIMRTWIKVLVYEWEGELIGYNPDRI